MPKNVLEMFTKLRENLTRRSSLSLDEFIESLNSAGFSASRYKSLGTSYMDHKSDTPIMSVKLGSYTLTLKIREIDKPYPWVFYESHPLNVDKRYSISYGTDLYTTKKKGLYTKDEYSGSMKRGEGFCYEYGTNQNFHYGVTYYLFDFIYMSSFSELVDSLHDAFVRRAFLDNTLLKKVLYKLYDSSIVEREKVNTLKQTLSVAHRGIYSAPIKASYLIENYTTDDWNNSINVGAHVIHEDASGVWCILTPDVALNDVDYWYELPDSEWVTYGLRLISYDKWKSFKDSRFKTKIKQNPPGFYPAVDPNSYLKVVDSGVVGLTLEEAFSVKVPDWTYKSEAFLSNKQNGLSKFGELVYRDFTSSVWGFDSECLIQDIAEYFFDYEEEELESLNSYLFPRPIFKFGVSVGEGGDVSMKVVRTWSKNNHSEPVEVKLDVYELFSRPAKDAGGWRDFISFLLKCLLKNELLCGVRNSTYTVSFTVYNKSNGVYEFSLVGA